MLVRFFSRAGADIWMQSDAAHAVLRAMGREPAAQGVFLASDIPAALQALEHALAEERVRESETDPLANDEDAGPAPLGVGLRQRAWPVQDLMRRAAAREQAVQWGPP